MQFYTKKHQYYCGIDLHTKIIYICLLDSDGKVLEHKQTKANPEALMTVIKPYSMTWLLLLNVCLPGIGFPISVTSITLNLFLVMPST